MEGDIVARSCAQISYLSKQVDLVENLATTLTTSLRDLACGELLTPDVQAVIGGLPRSATPEVTVLFGSQTGNAQSLAQDLAQRLDEDGLQVTLRAMDQFEPRRLARTATLFLLVSTHGNGDPPDNALGLHEYVLGRRAPDLCSVRFAVLALGDRSYEQFCKVGKDFDQRMAELGAERLLPLESCDVDYEDQAAAWIDAVRSILHHHGTTRFVPAAASPRSVVPAASMHHSRSRPHLAEVLENLNLNGRGSTKETRHVELSLAGSGISYEPGDAIGVYPENDPELVDLLVAEMGWSAEEPVPTLKGVDEALRTVLLREREITRLTRPLLERVAALRSSALTDLLVSGRSAELEAYTAGRDLLDLVRDFRLQGVPARAFMPIMRRLPPRLYSIASSSVANPEEVHLTVRCVRYAAHGRPRKGVCSNQIGTRVIAGDVLPVYVHRNPNFKLPEDPAVPLIMIGAGTGIAPFRSFVQERAEIGRGGRMWLFFGDRNFRTDFLYQIEWQRWLRDGVLTQMDVAFSRDSESKVYVQHRLLKQSHDVFAWLEDGAFIYVCGDEKEMAGDVHRTLELIVAREGGMVPDKAAAYVENLRRNRRYQRDVY